MSTPPDLSASDAALSAAASHRARGFFARAWQESLAPHPDSPHYPHRKRIRFVAPALALAYVAYGVLWTWLVPLPGASLTMHLLGGAAAALVGLNSYRRILPGVTQVALYGLVLWFCFPFLFMWMYVSTGFHHVPQAMLCGTMVIFASSTTWRAAILSFVFAVLTAVPLAWAMQGYVSLPHPLDALLLASSMLCGVLISYSAADVQSRRTRMARGVVQVMTEQLQQPLNLQVALGQALHFEQQNASHAQLADTLHALTQEFDATSRQAREALAAWQGDLYRSMDFGQTKTLQIAEVIPHVLADLAKSHGLGQAVHDGMVRITLHHNFALEANLSSFTRMLSSVTASMLLAQELPSEERATRSVHVSCSATPTGSLIRMTAKAAVPASAGAASSGWPSSEPASSRPPLTSMPENPASTSVDSDATADAGETKTRWRRNSAASAAAYDGVITSYAQHILRRMGGKARLRTDAQGVADVVELSFPRSQHI